MNICVFCSSSSNLDPMYTEAADALGREIARRGHTLVFGGYDMGLMGAVARAALDPMYTEAADALGREIARRGHTLVFGGYDMGLMGAVARAAVEESGRVLGVTTEGLSAKGRAAVEGIEEECAVDLSARKERMVELSDAFVSLPGGLGTFDEGLSAKGRAAVEGIEEECAVDLSARKERMVELSDAFVSLPGGLGTFDEFFSVISRVKAGEIEAKSALFDVDGFFAPLAELLDDATTRGLNSTDWRAHCDIFDNAQELLDWIEA